MSQALHLYEYVINLLKQQASKSRKLKCSSVFWDLVSEFDTVAEPARAIAQWMRTNFKYCFRSFFIKIIKLILYFEHLIYKCENHIFGSNIVVIVCSSCSTKRCRFIHFHRCNNNRHYHLQQQQHSNNHFHLLHRFRVLWSTQVKSVSLSKWRYQRKGPRE